MARVFISYAHSSLSHRDRVRSFAEYLREQKLDVVIDTDVKGPAGPPEQWPRWMKNQVEVADWVVLFIDETYRRRFDGHEVPDKGYGVTWEGCIITHELYRSKTMNHKFIPVLADGESWDLVPTEIAGATIHRIPSGQQELARSILDCQAEAGTASSRLHSAEYEDWRDLTVSEIADAILRLQTDRRRKEVANLFQLKVDDNRDQLELHFRKLVDRCTDPASFDVRSTCLAVAQLDAYRTDASGHADDFQALTDLQDWLFPLCIHPAVKATVASGMDDRHGAIISESVALEVGAELAAAPADGRRVGFRISDDGQIIGDGLLRMVDTPTGDPDPNVVVEEILKDLADQLCIILDDDDTNEPDAAKRIHHLVERMQLQAALNAIAKRRRYYCIIDPSKNSAGIESLRKLLSDVRRKIPEIVFFELHNGQTKSAEEVILKIVKDRLESERQS